MKTPAIIWITVAALLWQQNAPAQNAPAAPANAQVPEYICPRTTGTITLDGILDEPGWQVAPVIDGFLTLGPKGEPAENISKAQLLHDDKYLYIGADLTTLPGKLPNTIEGTKRDFGVYGNDGIEIFLVPRESEAVTYHFLVSAHGYLHDIKYEPKNPDPDSWNSQTEIKTQQRPGGWSLETAIPLSDLQRKVFRGDVWVFRIAVAASGFPHAMWPRNQELGFNNKACRAYLIFDDRNLVVNGDFETGAANTNTPPPGGWRYAVNTDPKISGQGVIRLVTLPDAPQGPRVLEIDKTDETGHYPALLFENMPVEPGATYEFSAWVKSEKSFHAGVSFLGPETKVAAQRVCVRGERPYPAAPDFRQIKVQYRTNPDVISAAIVFRYQNQRGKLWVDGVTFQRVNGLAAAGQKSKMADPIHNLVELSRRTAFKPYWLLKKPDGWYRNERTVFKDTGTGATIWKMSRHPGYQCRQEYMEFPPWNCHGERLLLTSLPEWWKIDMKPDGRAWKPMEGIYSYFWDRLDPDILWYVATGGHKLVKQNVVTGEILFSKTFSGTLDIWPMSRDGKYSLLKESIPSGGRTESRIHLVPRDASVVNANIITINPQGEIHQLWFSNRPDYSMSFTWEDYLRGGRILKPDGKIVKDIKYGTPVPGGHNAPSPSGKWFITADGYLKDAITEETMWITDHSMGHQSWGPDGDAWFMGSAGFDIRRFGVPPGHFDQLLGSANSKMKYSLYCCEEHPVVSPDGTKAGYASNMLGYSDFYNLIMRLPQAPLALTARKTNGAVRLEWQPARHTNEIALYHVYRSKFMTGPYEYAATVPGNKTSYDQAGSDKSYFVVTAQEHSGLESYYSNPATVDRRQIPFKMPSGGALARLMSFLGWRAEPFIASAEAGEYENPGEEIFNPTAANLYAVALGLERPCAGLTLKVNVPHEVEGMVYGRFQNMRDDLEPALESYVNKAKAGEVKLKEKKWHWVNLSGPNKIRFEPGLAEIKLVPLESGIAVDQIVIVNSADAVPKIFWGRDHTPPEPVREITAEAVDPYDVRLKWKAPEKNADVAYYNVYAARGTACVPANETLISSPTGPEVLDWGLMAGTNYAYRVTAVDRAGNESRPSETKIVATPAVPERVFIQQACSMRTTGTNRLDLSFKLDKAQDVYFWVKMQCFNQNEVVRFKVYVDNNELCEPYQFPVYFITPHHPGPVSGVWFWSRIVNSFKKSDEGRQALMPVKAGEHVLSLVPDTEFNKRYGNIDVEIGEVVITNDKGYVPSGIVNWLIDPDRGR